MQVSKSWYEETARDLIWEFENLLCSKNIKINNDNPKENEFEYEDSYINKKDYNILKNEIIKQLISFADYVEYTVLDVA